MSTNQHKSNLGGACASESNTNINTPVIPPDINAYSLRESATFYTGKLNFAVHPLTPSGSGDSASRGKKPLLKGWRDHTHADVTPEFLDEHFGAGSNKNIGCVVAAPHVVVDLDSKPDGGASVQEWLLAHPEIAHVPREITAGGAHIHFMCHDVPDEVSAQKTALVAKLNREVQAELFHTGNVVLSPSAHATGHKYQWDVFGEIPSVSWSFLASTFGFVAPAPKKRGRPKKQPEWWHHIPQDLGSLDLPGMMEELGLLGRRLDNHPPKFAVRCPWENEHSKGATAATPGSDTAILCPPDKWPVLNCLHAHCAGRGLEHLVAFAESEKPGIIAKHCSRLRTWSPGAIDDLGREQLVLPGKGKPMGEFCSKLGKGLAVCKQVFRFGGKVVEVELNGSSAVAGCSLTPIPPAALITALETCVEVGVLTKDLAGGDVFVPQSMCEDVARVVLASRAFRDELPEIRRVLNVRIPMLDDDGAIVLPDFEYDERFKTYVDPNAPELVPMAFADAKALLADLLAGPEHRGFWWKDDYAKDLALARLLSPYTHGLMDFKRGPVWAYNGNLPGAGKDTCASVPVVIYTGHAAVGAPLDSQNDDEMRKRITSAVMVGARFLHVANLKGDINFPSLEAATDNSGVWEDRVLGSSKRIQMCNELDVSLSFNGASWTPDLDRRLRVIDLHCPLEDLGSFEYRHPDILGLVRENRELILSALHALVLHWDEQGRPEGPTSFASFPQWGAVVGGIMTCCGYSDPCRPQQRDADAVGGDETTASMKELFRLAFEHFGSAPVRRQKFISFAVESEAVCELFATCDLNTRGGRSSFMKSVLKFNRRQLGGILFVYTYKSKNQGTCRFIGPEGGPLGSPGVTSVSYPSLPGGDEGLEGLSPSSSTETNKNTQHASEPWNYIPLLGTEGNKSLKSPKSLPPRVCTNDDQLAVMMSELMDKDMIAVAAVYEKSARGLDILKTTPKSLLLQGPRARAWRIDLADIGRMDTLDAALRLCLVGKTVVAHDAQPILRWLQARFGFMPTTIRCTRTAAHLLSNGLPTDDDFGTCLMRYLPSHDGTVPGGKVSLKLMAPATKRPEQARNQVENLHALLAAMEVELDRHGLMASWMLENEALPAFSAMEVNGVQVDLPLLSKLADEGDAQAKVLLAAVNASTSRIHSTFDPLGTVTGRATSSNPPLQNVKHGTLREAFAAPDDRCLVIGDYSNIDLRVVAAEARDEAMLEIFSRNEDLHTMMAARLFGKSAEDITPEERRIAKAMNLGFINGQDHVQMIHSAKKMHGLTLTADHTWPFTSLFQQAFPRIAGRIDECQRNAEAGVSEVRTRLGRRRLIPEDTPANKRSGILLNTPIQGGTADGMKKAMALLHKRLPADALLVCNIHDELIVECPVSMAAEIRQIVNETMADGMNWAYPNVRIDVEITVGKTWADKDRKDNSTTKEGRDDSSATGKMPAILILDETNHSTAQ